MQYVFPFIIESNISKWKENKMERHHFTQYESMIEHKNCNVLSPRKQLHFKEAIDPLNT